MAIGVDNYAAVDDDEDLLPQGEPGSYAPAVPPQADAAPVSAPAPNGQSSAPPVEATVGGDNAPGPVPLSADASAGTPQLMRRPSAATQQPPASGMPPAGGSAPLPPPQWKDYAPAEPTTKMGRFGRVLGDMFTGEPKKDMQRSIQGYDAALKGYDAATTAATGQSEAKLRGAQANEAQARADTIGQTSTVTMNGIQYTIPTKDLEKFLGTSGTNATKQDIATGNNTTAVKTTGMRDTTSERNTDVKTASAQDIAADREASQERIAKGHDLVSTEVARIRAASANDPNKLTNTMKTMKQQAAVTLPKIQQTIDQTEEVANLLGPGEGRWNDFMQGKIGVKDPAFAHYKDQTEFVASAVALAHARGRMSGELYDHFLKMFDAGKQSPENMIAALQVAQDWLGDYAKMGEPGTSTGPPAAPPSGGSAPPKVMTPAEYLAQAKKGAKK